jgi:hypothetical protein
MRVNDLKTETQLAWAIVALDMASSGWRLAAATILSPVGMNLELAMYWYLYQLSKLSALD